MSRQKGIANVSFNFEPQVSAPVDARTLVTTKADLIASTTFNANDGNNYAYVGMVVAVTQDSTVENNGLYQLMALPTTIESNWKKVGSDVAIATADTVGIVKPDNETITVQDDGTICGKPITLSYVEFTTLQANGQLVPGQGYVITDDNTVSTVDNYIQDGTIITVGTSGADYTNLQGALDYLEGKISNGNVTIHINAGTYTTSEQLLTKKCNISRLIIEGTENFGSQINTSFASSDGALHHEMDYTLELKDFYINLIGSATNARGIDTCKSAKLILNNVKCTNFPSVGITCNSNSNIYATLHSTIIITGSNRGLLSAGLFYLDYNVTLSFTNVTTAICTSAGGIFHYNSLIKDYTNVTNGTSQTVNTATDTGLIMGTISA